MNNKYKKILCLFLYILISIFLVYLIKPNYFVSILIVLGPPSLINFIWLKKSRFKILCFSLIATILFAIPLELMCRLKDAWDVTSIFPRLFYYIPIENILFAFFNIFWVLSFYEYFIDRDSNKKISKNFKFLILLFVFFSILVFSLFFYNKNLVGLDYYLMAIPVLIIPALIIFFKYPKLLKKTILTTIFFALIFFVYEIVSMKLGHWWWPGDYLYDFNIFGMRFPIDDVLIWYLLSTPVLIGGYEFFVDDHN